MICEYSAVCYYVVLLVISICTHVSVESVQYVEQLIQSSKREDEMLAYVSCHLGQSGAC